MSNNLDKIGCLEKYKLDTEENILHLDNQISELNDIDHSIEIEHIEIENTRIIDNNEEAHIQVYFMGTLPEYDKYNDIPGSKFELNLRNEIMINERMIDGLN